MFILTKDKGQLVNFIINTNEEDSEWSLEYAAPGFFFYTDDKELETAVSKFIAELESA